MSGIMFVKCKIQDCGGELPSVVKDSLQAGGLRCVEEEVTQVDGQTHTLTDTSKHTFPTNNH
jgi:hypothetical protein